MPGPGHARALAHAAPCDHGRDSHAQAPSALRIHQALVTLRPRARLNVGRWTTSGGASPILSAHTGQGRPAPEARKRHIRSRIHSREPAAAGSGRPSRGAHNSRRLAVAHNMRVALHSSSRRMGSAAAGTCNSRMRRIQHIRGIRDIRSRTRPRPLVHCPAQRWPRLQVGRPTLIETLALSAGAWPVS